MVGVPVLLIYVFRLDVLPLSEWVLSSYSGFIPHSKNVDGLSDVSDTIKLQSGSGDGWLMGLYSSMSFSSDAAEAAAGSSSSSDGVRSRVE